MNDRQIIAGLTARLETALVSLGQRYGSGLMRLARNILDDPQEAEECVNDTYLALWNSIPPEQPDPLAPYIYRICRNLALKCLRHNTAQKRNSHLDLSLEELGEIFHGTTLEEEADARALGQAIDRFLYTLNKENRILFLRRYWFGDSIQTIAKMRGMTENSVSVRLNRIRGKLRSYLIKEGYL